MAIEALTSSALILFERIPELRDRRTRDQRRLRCGRARAPNAVTGRDRHRDQIRHQFYFFCVAGMAVALKNVRLTEGGAVRPQARTGNPLVVN